MLQSRLHMWLSNVPGTAGENKRIRGNMLGMIEELQQEGVERTGVPETPSVFCTATSLLHKWGQLNRVIRRWYGKPEILQGGHVATARRRMYDEAAENPFLVAFYVNLKYELLVRLSGHVMSVATGGIGGYDFFIRNEWSGSGIPHVHFMVWLRGVPRVDKAEPGDGPSPRRTRRRGPRD